jgi:photosystem II stability/assembly factor-like uncharacterized protein
MTDQYDPLKEALRDSLHRHAADAPRGDLLAERIINTAQHPTQADRHAARHGWRTWTLPLIAAGAVAAVVGAVVGIENFRPQASPQNPGTAPASVLSTPSPTHTHSTPTSQPPSKTVSTNPGPTGLSGVQITDLTFAYGQGWALGSADCLSGPGRCTALWHTVDGRHWTSMGGEQFNVTGVKNCADPCVNTIRFATQQIGYAFGPTALFMTTDGGASWQRQKGGALQLETLDSNVIRVTGTSSGCPGPCIDGIETSAVGSTDWTSSNFHPASSSVNTVLLARGNGGYAYLLVARNPAGGASDETSTLYRSVDKGLTWRPVGEPCPQHRQEVDSVSVAGGDEGRAAVLCMTRQAPNRYRVATSTNGGATFADQPGRIPIAASFLTGDPNTVLVAAGDGGMARSIDGGQTWQPITDVTGAIGWVGFESQQVGRALSADGTTIWTTRDAGATWHRASIG